jgi:hypothetical protein
MSKFKQFIQSNFLQVLRFDKKINSYMIQNLKTDFYEFFML